MIRISKEDSFAGNVVEVEEDTVAEAGIAAAAAEEGSFVGSAVDDAVSMDRMVTMDCSRMEMMMDVEGSASSDHVEDS